MMPSGAGHGSGTTEGKPPAYFNTTNAPIDVMWSDIPIEAHKLLYGAEILTSFKAWGSDGSKEWTLPTRLIEDYDGERLLLINSLVQVVYTIANPPISMTILRQKTLAPNEVDGNFHFNNHTGFTPPGGSINPTQGPGGSGNLPAWQIADRYRTQWDIVKRLYASYGSSSSVLGTRYSFNIWWNFNEYSADSQKGLQNCPWFVLNGTSNTAATVNAHVAYWTRYVRRSELQAAIPEHMPWFLPCGFLNGVWDPTNRSKIVNAFMKHFSRRVWPQDDNSRTAYFFNILCLLPEQCMAYWRDLIHREVTMRAAFKTLSGNPRRRTRPLAVRPAASPPHVLSPPSPTLSSEDDQDTPAAQRRRLSVTPLHQPSLDASPPWHVSESPPMTPRTIQRLYPTANATVAGGPASESIEEIESGESSDVAEVPFPPRFNPFRRKRRYRVPH